MWPFPKKAPADDEILKWLLQEKFIGLDYFLRVKKMPVPLPGEFEEEKPPKTKADLMADAERDYLAMRAILDAAYFEHDTDRQKQKDRLHNFYNRRLAEIAESQ